MSKFQKQFELIMEGLADPQFKWIDFVELIDSKSHAYKLQLMEIEKALTDLEVPSKEANDALELYKDIANSPVDFAKNSCGDEVKTIKCAIEVKNAISKIDARVLINAFDVIGFAIEKTGKAAEISDSMHQLAEAIKFMNTTDVANLDFNEFSRKFEEATN